MRVLFGLCSWGIGHATRSLPIIRKLISEGNTVTIASSDRALLLLKRELGERAEYVDFPEIPNPYSKTDFSLTKFGAYIPLIMSAIARERVKVTRLTLKNKYDAIISDHAYGFNSFMIPSYLLLHQLRFIAPQSLKSAEILTELFNFSMTQAFNKICVLDFEKQGLSGNLSHNLAIPRSNVEYIGPTSSFEAKDSNKDVDCLVLISGPEPQRTAFEKKVLKQVGHLEGRIVVALGKPEMNKQMQKSEIEIHNYLSPKEWDMSRAKLIVSRSGYSTVCDVAQIGAKAFFIPMPGQTEQEYLGEYLKEKGWFYSKAQSEFNLAKDVKKAARLQGYPERDFTKKSVENFMRVIHK